MKQISTVSKSVGKGVEVCWSERGSVQRANQPASQTINGKMVTAWRETTQAAPRTQQGRHRHEGQWNEDADEASAGVLKEKGKERKKERDITW